MKPPRPYVVICRKASGADVVFTRTRDAAAADLLVQRLAGIGCPARAEPARPSDVPGLQRRGAGLKAAP